MLGFSRRTQGISSPTKRDFPLLNMSRGIPSFWGGVPALILAARPRGCPQRWEHLSLNHGPTSCRSCCFSPEVSQQVLPSPALFCVGKLTNPSRGYHDAKNRPRSAPVLRRDTQPLQQLHHTDTVRMGEALCMCESRSKDRGENKNSLCSPKSRERPDTVLLGSALGPAGSWLVGVKSALPARGSCPR